jgi:glycosyltransferase involved in cell wall biosynthesis
MPRVSIILPTYRRPGFLHSAISSVLNQTFEDFELIVVDDASGDNTGEIVGSFGDRRIRYVCLESNRGEAGARNAGLMKLDPRAEFVAFLDDDDEWLPDKLRKQVEFMESALLCCKDIDKRPP